MSIVVTTSAAELPVTLTEFKDHLKIDGTNEDTILDAFLTAATEVVQELQWRQLVEASFEWRIDSFGFNNSRITLPKPPLQSIDTIKYIDPNGDLQTLAADQYDATIASSDDYGSVAPSFSNSWPSTRSEKHAVRITFTGGYGTRTDVPDTTKAAIKILGAHLYETREELIVGQIITEVPKMIGVFSLIRIHALERH